MMSWESSIGQTPPRLPFFLMIVSRAPAALMASRLRCATEALFKLRKLIADTTISK